MTRSYGYGTCRSLTLAGALMGGMLLAVSVQAQAVQRAEDVDVLVVVAHPDDEAMFAATIYKITHELGGNVDLALVTDGSGGYRYSHLAEPIYGLDLTDEKVARQHLPAIRKRELMAAGRIIGVRNYFFLDQYDHEFTTNVDTVLQHVWDTQFVRQRLGQVMSRVLYDFVFVHLPIQDFHGHHKAASILALEAARALPAAQRPIVLGSFVGGREAGPDNPQVEPEDIPGYPITRVRDAAHPFIVDRMQPLDEDGRLNYQIIVNWEIAEHKSQGTMQLLMNRGDLERFWIFDSNAPDAATRTQALFDRLKVPAHERTSN